MLFSRTIRQFIKAAIIKKYVQASGWYFTEDRLLMIQQELTDWQNNYLPIDVKGKTVFDIGAGEGETALFFLANGAKKVYGIELESYPYYTLARNARVINELYRAKKLEVYKRAFKIGDLYHTEIDLIKIDIEGYEESILDVDHNTLKTPMVIEIHGLQLKDRFESLGYRLNRHVKAGWWTCYGFWKC